MAENTYERSDCLPPIGDIQPGSADEGKAVELIYARRQGIINALALPLSLAKTCRKIAVWGEDIDHPEQTKVIVHKIRQAIETQVSGHLKEPVKVTIEPIEQGEYAKWYWAGPPEAAQDLLELNIAIDPLFIGAVTPMGQFIPPQPLPLQLVMAIKQAAEALPDIVNPDYICKLDDLYTSKVLQKKFDVDWTQAKAEKWMRSRVYANVIEGWQLPFYEYDPLKGHILNRNSIFQTYIAQDCEDIDAAVEAGIDLYIDLNEAIAKYPSQKDAILGDDVSQGNLQPPSSGGRLPSQYAGQFRRPMVKKVVWWLRNQPVGIKAAVEAGLVLEQLDTGYEDPQPNASAPDGMGEGAGQIPASEPANTGAQDAVPAGGTDQTIATPGEGDQVQDDQAGGTNTPAPARYVLPDGTPVTPDSPEWPTALGQISIINNAVVEWIICPWPDIPLAHMRNTMVVGKPWGVGEPFYTQNLQDADSRIMRSAINYTEYNANPACEIRDDLKQSMKREYGSAFIDPGKMVGVPAAAWQANNPLVRFIEPPPFSDSSLQIRAMIGQDFNEVAGRPDVLAGNSPSPQDSGRKIEQLTMNAAEPLNFKAQEIAYCAEKIAALMLHAILNYVDPAKMADELSISLPLLMLVLDRANRRPPNVQITVSTGAGSVLERKRQLYLQYNQLVSPDDGLPLADGKSTRDMVGVDSNKSTRSSLQARRDAMAAMPMQPQEGGEKKPQNGDGGSNGQHSSNGNGRMNGS